MGDKIPSQGEVSAETPSERKTYPLPHLWGLLLLSYVLVFLAGVLVDYGAWILVASAFVPPVVMVAVTGIDALKGEVYMRKG